jgi:hypothetical protein
MNSREISSFRKHGGGPVLGGSRKVVREDLAEKTQQGGEQHARAHPPEGKAQLANRDFLGL